MKCMVDDCQSPILAKGFCEVHYARNRKYGDPLFTKIRSAPTRAAINFLFECAASKSMDCIEWPFARNSSGYGKVNFRGKCTNASRAICILVNGEPPAANYQAAHTCGNGAGGCVNGRHLVWKTPKQNQDDRVVHGTTQRGSDAPQAILHERDIPEIRKLLAEKSLTQAQIGSLFGVSKSAINNIAQGHRWAHVHKEAA